MRYALFVGTALLLAGCSSPSPEHADAPALQEASTDSRAAPSISLTAAPGVAVTYRYAFQLPDAQIAGIQEVHAAACETLGIARCRITGMHYQLMRRDHVAAELDFKLDPSLARRFGKDAIASVEKARGILSESEIRGTNAGESIAASQTRSGEIAARLDEITKQLAVPGLGARERAVLQEKAANLRAELDVERGQRRDDAASLASTPMHFSYVGSASLPGFGPGGPLGNALDAGLASLTTMTGFVLLLLSVGLPWAALAGLGLVAWRSRFGTALRKWLRRPESQE